MIEERFDEIVSGVLQEFEDSLDIINWTEAIVRDYPDTAKVEAAFRSKIDLEAGMDPQELLAFYRQEVAYWQQVYEPVFNKVVIEVCLNIIRRLSTQEVSIRWLTEEES